MDAYGAGILKTQADQHGFVLVTPLTYDFRGNQIGEMFDALIAALSMGYTIDRDRVSVLGHSMGGGAVSQLVSARSDSIKSAACLCGFGGFGADVASVPPTLVIAAQYDPLANPARLEPLAKAAKDRGLPVEYRLIEDYGHTITVGKVMPETVKWLLDTK
jgi:dienelactone hydrolase